MKRTIILNKKRALIIFGLTLIFISFFVSSSFATYQTTPIIAAGGFHTVGLKNDGTLLAAGLDPVNVSSWKNIKAIDAGSNHTVGLKEDGTVMATGSNSSGQLNVSSWTNIKEISAGNSHTVGIKEDGTVVAVGNNYYGQLNVSSWTNIKSIAAGYYYTIGLKEDGTVMATGGNFSGQLNVSSWINIKAIAAGEDYTVGLKEDGTVVAAGYSGYGQLNVSSWTNIKEIAAGHYHTVGLKEDGMVVAVGNNSSGQLNVSSWTNIKTIAEGEDFTVGLKEDGTVVAVGNNSSGQLNVSSWTNIKTIATGDNYTIGLKEDGTVMATGGNLGQLDVSSWTNIKAIAAGYDHTVGLNENGTVVAVGNNSYGQLNVSSWTNIKAIAAGGRSTVGLNENGTVVAVGREYFAGLLENVSSWTNIKAIAVDDSYIVGLKEDGTVVSTYQQDLSSWVNIKAIAVGSSHAVGLKGDGTVVSYGWSNFYGQENVSSWTNIKAIAAGGSHTVGLKENGTVVAVGDNTYGQLKINSWTNIKAIAAGDYHTVGLKGDGTVVAVGRYESGQLNVSSWNLGAFDLDDPPSYEGSPDPYEPDDLFGEAKIIPTNNTSQTHSIYPTKDSDWIKFETTEEKVYKIDTFNLSYNMDTVIYLYSDSGELIDKNDDYIVGSFASEIDFKSKKSGYYFVNVKHYDEQDGAGDYDIKVDDSQPDLVIQGTAPSEAPVGEYITIPLSIINQGQGNLINENGIDISLYPDLENPPALGQFTSIYKYFWDDLNPQKTINSEFKIKYDVPGLKKMYIYVDNKNLVQESDKKNNLLGPFHINVRKYIPDLVVKSITPAKTTIVAGDTVSIPIVIKNQGQDKFFNNDGVDISFYANLSSPPSLYQETNLFDYFYDSLAPGETHTHNFYIKFNTLGLRNMYAYVDNDDEIEESIESNNWLGPVNLNVVTDPTAVIDSVNPSLATPGKSVTFKGHGVTASNKQIIEYSWRSNIDGVISNSQTFSKNNLSIGSHEIFFKVKNNLGQWSVEVKTTLEVKPFPSTSFSVSSANEINGWYAKPPEITLTRDVNGKTYYRWGSGIWKLYRSSFYAIRGVNVFSYYSKDEINNKEIIKSIKFKVDDYIPQTFAPKKSVVKKGDYTFLYWKVSDPYAGDKAFITINIKNGNKVIKRINLGLQKINRLRKHKLKARLSKGTYTFSISARDRAGNSEEKAARNWLIVK